MVDLSIDPKKTSKNIISFIQQTFKKTGFEKAVIGLSGGIDSSVSFLLAVKALGAENVIGVMMPYGDLYSENVHDLEEWMRQIDFPVTSWLNINIEPAVSVYLKQESNMDDLRKGNLMVRIRMMILYDLSKKHKALVLGTENRTEYLLGYFTRFGDEASDIEPVIKLYKTQIYQLAKYLRVPNKIIQKEPSAGLFSGQTDEADFGFTYADADQILFLHVDKKLSEIEIIERGFGKEIVEKVFKRMRENEFKHLLPYKI